MFSFGAGLTVFLMADEGVVGAVLIEADSTYLMVLGATDDGLNELIAPHEALKKGIAAWVYLHLSILDIYQYLI